MKRLRKLRKLQARLGLLPLEITIEEGAKEPASPEAVALWQVFSEAVQAELKRRKDKQREQVH